MPIRLLVNKNKDPEFEIEREINEVEITIGRDIKNTIVLEDKKKFVSKEHAKILFDNGNYYLFDFSRNGTFVNNQRLKSNHPYALDNGSKFVIGEFLIEVVIKEPDEGLTRVIINPFKEEIKTISELIHRIDEKYQQADPLFREEFIKETYKDLLEVINSSTFQKYTGNKTSNDQEFSLKMPDRVQENEIMIMLLDNFVKLLQGISKFRSEFIGTTMVQSEDSINVQSKEKLQDDLFNEHITPEQREKKINSFKNECEKIILHQIALLNGYRESIHEGVLILYNELNPLNIKQKILNEKIEIGPVSFSKRLIPFLVKIKVLKNIQLKFQNIDLEDIGFIEKKYFRPSFSRKYLEMVSSSQKTNSNSNNLQ